MSKKEYYVEIEESDKLVLPSEIERKKRLKKNKPKSKTLKWGTIFLIIALIYLFYNPILNSISAVLKANPTIYSNYLYIESQISNLTLPGLFFFSIFGTLFFLILPSEATFILYLSSTSFNVLFIVLFALVGNLLGMSFNYFFGRILGERVIQWMFKKKFWKYKETIEKYGGYLLLFGNILPGPIELLAVFYGGFKFSYTRYLYLVFIGRLIKYILLFVAFFFFWEEIIFYYNSILGKFSFLVELYDLYT